MPTPAFVQQAVAQITAAASVTVTLSAAPTNGNVLIACVALSASGDSVSSVSQTNVFWSFVARNAGGMDLEIWVGIVRASAGTGVSFAWGAANSASAINVSEFSGLSGTTDGSPAFNSGTSLNNTAAFTSTTGSYTSANAVDLIYVGSGCTRAVVTSSLTAGYTALTTANPGGTSAALSAGYQVVSSAGSQSCTFSYPAGFSGVKAWDTVIVGLNSGTPSSGGLFLASLLNGVTTGGPFFSDPLSAPSHENSGIYL